MSPDQLGRATSREMSLCRGWKTAAASGPKLRSRCCTGCGLNTVHQSMLSRTSRPFSASARYCNPNFVNIFRQPEHTTCLFSTLCLFCCVYLVSGHAVEAQHGGELRHLPISQLPVRLSAAEGRRTLGTYLSEVFRDDHSTVPGPYSLY